MKSCFMRDFLFFIMNIVENRFLTKIDEINQLFYKPSETYADTDALNQAVHDYLVDMFLEGYAVIGYTLDDIEREADYELIETLLLMQIDGKTLFDRIDEYYDISKKEQTEEKSEEKSVEGATETADVPKIAPENAIQRVLETEGHRIYVEGGYARAGDCGAKFKVWHTMEDDKVRDTHSYIENDEIPIDAEFFTYDGDKALMPGGFELPENNVNCRCWLSYSF